MQMQNSNAKIKNYKVIKGVNNLLHTRLSKTIFFGTKVKMMMMIIIIIIIITIIIIISLLISISMLYTCIYTCLYKYTSMIL